MAEILEKQIYQINYPQTASPFTGAKGCAKKINKLELEIEKKRNLGETFCGERIDFERL